MPPMEVTMLRTELGQDESESGASHPQKRYFAGETYAVGHSLAKAFIEMRAAKPAVDKKVEAKAKAEAEKKAKAEAEAEAEKKAKAGAPQNKATSGAPENKGE
jgi:hypothetical protein